MKQRGPALVFAVGFLIGALIWHLAPRLVGKVEAWDAFGYYALSLLAAGVVAALCSPKHFLLAPVGIFWGQVAYIALFLRGDGLWVIGLIFGAVLCVVPLLGSGAVYLGWRTVNRTGPAGRP